MIYCPACGTANRDGSKFCNECGMAFAQLSLPHSRMSPASGSVAPPGPSGEASAPPPPSLPAACPACPPNLRSGLNDGGGQARGGLTREGATAPSLRPPAEAPGSADAGGLPAWLQELPLPVAAAFSRPAGPDGMELGPSDGTALLAESLAEKAQLFAAIVGPPQTAAVTTAAQGNMVWGGALRRGTSPWILYAFLFVAVLLPLLGMRSGQGLLPGPLSFLGRGGVLRGTEKTSPAVAGLVSQIESLSDGDAVLVAIDYDPSTLGEMDVVARTILRHLTERGARVVTVSLLPAGAGTAQRLLDEVYAAGYGQSCANLGYLPGQTAAVRFLGQPFVGVLRRDFQDNPLRDLPVMEGLSTVQDFDLIVEFAANQESLRWWVEQAGTAHDVPLAAGTSASIEPLVRPYYETQPRQLVGLVGGVPGAAMYDVLRSGTLRISEGEPLGKASTSAEVAAKLDALLVGVLVFVLTVLVGNGVFLLQRTTGRGRR